MLWIRASNISAIPMQVFSSALLNKSCIKDLSQPVPSQVFVAVFHKAREAQQK